MGDITEGESDGQMGTAVLDGEGEGGGGEETFDAKAIYDAEVKRLTEQEGDDKKRATDFHAYEEGKRSQEGAEENSEENTGETAEEGQEGGGEEEQADSEQAGDEQQSAEEEQKVEKKQRNDWKKQAIEAQQEKKLLEDRLNALEAKISEKANDDGDSDKKPDAPTVEHPEIKTEELSQEVKDLLDFTPGLDKLIRNLALESAKSLIEKTEQDRAKTLQEAEQSEQAQEKESSYWNDVDTWFQGQYPELTLSEIREDPDFNDWLEYRKSWVDTQLNGVDRFNVSGAQKVFERYVTENGLANPGDASAGDNSSKRLAAARTPSMGKKTTTPSKASRNLFQEEVDKLKTGSNNRYI